MLEPRLAVAVQPAIFHSVGLWMTTWMPSHISCQKPLRPDAVAGAGFGSGFLINQMETAETRYETASIKMASAAPIAWIAKPAIAGPASCAVDRLTSILELPSTRSARSIRAGRYDWYEIPKKTLKTPTTRPTAYSCSMVNTPKLKAMGMVNRATMRPRSEAIINGRRFNRSAYTPATRPSTGKGRNSSAVSSPTWKGAAWSSRMATVGTASALTWVPASLIVWPTHRRMKSASRHRRPPSARSQNPIFSDMERNPCRSARRDCPSAPECKRPGPATA